MPYGPIHATIKLCTLAERWAILFKRMGWSKGAELQACNTAFRVKMSCIRNANRSKKITRTHKFVGPTTHGKSQRSGETSQGAARGSLRKSASCLLKSG